MTPDDPPRGRSQRPDLARTLLASARVALLALAIAALALEWTRREPASWSFLGRQLAAPAIALAAALAFAWRARAARAAAPDDTVRPPRVAAAALAGAAALLALAGALGWARAIRAEGPLRIPIPASWVDLSPGTPDRDFERFAPGVLEQARLPNLIAYAVEPPQNEARRPDQVLAAQRLEHALNAPEVERTLPGQFAAAYPRARVVSHAVETVQGVRAVRAEIALPRGSAILYALPDGPRTALVVFTCAPRACDHVREVAAATVNAIEGLAEPDDGARRQRLRVEALASVAALLAAGVAALLAVELAVRRRAAVAGPAAS